MASARNPSQISANAANSLSPAAIQKVTFLQNAAQPTWKDIHEESLGKKLEAGIERRQFVKVEEGRCFDNLGSNRFIRILTFKNGRLTGIKTGGYGYDMKQKRT